MCHYEKLTVPVPAVNVTTVSEPSVALDDVKPDPTVIVVSAVANLKITIPEPPLAPRVSALLAPRPPPPEPVFVVPAVALVLKSPPAPPPPEPPACSPLPLPRPPPPPPALITA